MKSGNPFLKFDFKNRKVVGNPDVDISASRTYAHILTVYGWRDNTGGYPTQISFGQDKVGIRTGISNDRWSAWRKYSDDSFIQGLIDSSIAKSKAIQDETTDNEYKFIVRNGVPALEVIK